MVSVGELIQIETAQIEQVPVAQATIVYRGIMICTPEGPSNPVGICNCRAHCHRCRRPVVISKINLGMVRHQRLEVVCTSCNYK